MGETIWVCQPCRDGTHLECDSSKEKSCQCIICEGERIGDQVMGDTGGNMPRRKQ